MCPEAELHPVPQREAVFLPHFASEPLPGNRASWALPWLLPALGRWFQLEQEPETMPPPSPSSTLSHRPGHMLPPEPTVPQESLLFSSSLSSHPGQVPLTYQALSS